MTPDNGLDNYLPNYINLHKTGELQKRVSPLKEKLKSCTVCPHHCKVDRLKNERGICGAGKDMAIASYGPHFGEENVLVGNGGSGTVFFSHCALQCVFCQNYDISCHGGGSRISATGLADIMLTLQARGCHNINFVTPSHFVPQIVESLPFAVEGGLELPLVYNSGGYDDIDTLKLLDGIIDIYMPDLKFSDNKIAKKYTKAPNYFDTARLALIEMRRQVGDLKTDSAGRAYKGLLVRHLVMPENLAGTEKIMEFISREISEDTMVNVMGQYFPAHRAHTFPELSRRVNGSEYNKAVQCARKSGLKRAIT
ncbi:MAG TPA: radical SAM protein [Clostridia bacterium]|nr:radical SAM protein [Clostridia bacterium]